MLTLMLFLIFKKLYRKEKSFGHQISLVTVLKIRIERCFLYPKLTFFNLLEIMDLVNHVFVKLIYMGA